MSDYSEDEFNEPVSSAFGAGSNPRSSLKKNSNHDLNSLSMNEKKTVKFGQEQEEESFNTGYS